MAEAKIHVTLKPGVLDPQGLTIKRALEALGFSEAEEVRVGKYIVLRLADGEPAALRQRVEEMCGRLLANPVIEQYDIDLSPSD